MPTLIKDRVIAEDPYVAVAPAEDGTLTLPASPVLASLATWQAFREQLLKHPHAKGVHLKPDQFADDIASDLAHFELVAIEFPGFADGRGYSTALTLRGRLGFRGELRAIGDVFKDTVFYQQRCGFNAFAIKDGKNAEDALKGLETFSTPYQGTATEASPLYRRRLA